MKDYNNVECHRCGYRWWSEKYSENGELPEDCPRCYRNAVAKIPDPPTRIDRIRARIDAKKAEIPGKIEEKRHSLVLWKEQNTFLISMVFAAVLMVGVIGAIGYALFLM
ncbi:hypothetical protein [Candidatus Nanohalococcus occultus]|uniref:Zn finger protein, C2H2 n=1 Tax=Candidatus Nanohalococcus occultus TaxID=2978047 RepID=A0ABY8CDM7_9ARCH|nr:Zn finger protein, C2H2 [Candidatus Nanohaloarchaeota archaeon SVXNc]